MTKILIVETCQHGGRTYSEGDHVTVDDDTAAYLVSVGWAAGGPELDRHAVIDLDVQSLTSNTRYQES